MLRQVSDVILEQDQLWPPASNVETTQHLNFVGANFD